MSLVFLGLVEPGEIRTHDLFHAMEDFSITYRQSRQKHETYATPIWTPVDAKTPLLGA